MTGYPGVDFSSFRDFRWDLLRAEFERVRESAVTHDCWVIVGSAHPLDREHAPTNCVYVIAPTGAIETRYDKRRLYGQEVDHYSVGEGATTFTIEGIRAGVLICYDSCFPELYAELESARVQVLFHAFYNARSRSRGAMDQLMPAQLRTRAHDHSFLIVGSNSSASHSAMPSCIAAPDGRFSTLSRHEEGVLVESFPAADELWEYRREESAAIRGALEAFEVRIDHPRIRDRTAGP